MSTSIQEKTYLGFWVYLLTDLMMFGALFSVYLVLEHQTFGGPSTEDLLEPSYGFFLSVLLLLSSLMIGLADQAASQGKAKKARGLFLLTFAIGAAFFAFEMQELFRLVEEGHTWDQSAFLSALFTLIGTHAIHIFFGLLWILFFLGLTHRFGMGEVMQRRFGCLRMFWQFLNLIWVFLFSYLYLIGGNYG